MRTNTLKEKIERKQPVFGLFVSIPHPVIIEMIGHAEYDFVIIDLEHAATNMESVEELVRAAELAGMTPLVRISKVERTEILKVLTAAHKALSYLMWNSGSRWRKRFVMRIIIRLACGV